MIGRILFWTRLSLQLFLLGILFYCSFLARPETPTLKISPVPFPAPCPGLFPQSTPKQYKILIMTMNPIPGQQKSQLQTLITPDIKAQLEQFMKGPATTPATETNPKSQNLLLSFMEQVVLKFYHFDRAETRKIRRLVSYTGRMDVEIADEELRSMYTKYNFGCLAAIVVAFLIPKKLVSKSFAVLSVMLLKTAFLDRILFYRTLVHEATHNIFEDYSQEYRNVLTYFYDKKLKKEDSQTMRNMLAREIATLEQYTKEYDAFQKKRHLL